VVSSQTVLILRPRYKTFFSGVDRGQNKLERLVLARFFMLVY
jgi:hypothetical protein